MMLRGSGKLGHSLCSRWPYCQITPSQQGVSVLVSRSLSEEQYFKRYVSLVE